MNPLHTALHIRSSCGPNHSTQPTLDTPYPLENTPAAERSSIYEPEGREFDSLRARHLFQKNIDFYRCSRKTVFPNSL